MAHDPFRCAGQRYLPGARQAARGHEDQIDTQFLRGFCYFGESSSATNDCIPCSFISEMPFAQPAEVRAGTPHNGFVWLLPRDQTIAVITN